ncbi:hypothetical protein [Baekduia sp. Peel2402]|uniref:hypothetical protein n=1 Tax=Baekduia sp. Peel2402 TaxID=3458296 RepID=UPI00403E91EB
MPLDPINPIGPRPAARPGEIPGVRRVDSSTEKREREGQAPRKRRGGRDGVLPDLPPPPDDGRPHIDVRV